jgi:hypothetical protein
MAPRVTMAGACNRPQFFDFHLASLAKNDTPIEHVYVGHVDFPTHMKGRWGNLRPK